MLIQQGWQIQVTSKQTGFQCFQEQPTIYTPFHDQWLSGKWREPIILGDFWIVKGVFFYITSFDCYQMQARAVTPLSEKRPFFDLPDDASAEKHRAWAEQLWCRMDRDRSGTVTREELMCDWYGIHLEGFVFFCFQIGFYIHIWIYYDTLYSM